MLHINSVTNMQHLLCSIFLEKAWARDFGGCAHTNEAKLYGLRFHRRLRGIAFRGTAQQESPLRLLDLTLHSPVLKSYVIPPALLVLLWQILIGTAFATRNKSQNSLPSARAKLCCNVATGK